MFHSGSVAIGLNALPSHEPTPEFAIEFADTCNSFVDGLHDESLKQVAQLRLTDHNNAEIAELLGLTRRTVERKLLIIKARWESLAAEVQPG
jgi:DNA-directed RNA polymerase specialized sigma24 family protein